MNHHFTTQGILELQKDFKNQAKGKPTLIDCKTHKKITMRKSQQMRQIDEFMS